MKESILTRTEGNTPPRAKLEGGRKFVLHSDFEPAGDQPTAIAELVEGLTAGERDQVLLGATGTGKTFTMARIIEATQRPAIILAPNKTLAAQLYGEFRSFFPENAVEYFVSFYDYYQPEAYVPRTDTFIEKESQINEQIDRMRHAATRALLERDDVIIVASVSCIYGIGSPETYTAMTQDLEVGREYDQREIMAGLIAQQYQRNDNAFQRGTFRVRGDSLEIWPSHLEDRGWRLSFFGEELERIDEFDTLTGERTAKLEKVRVYANSHYVTPRPTLVQAIQEIKKELAERLAHFEREGKLLEAQRLEQRTRFDLEMLEATGHCNGIENYSRYLTGRAPGEPPPTLFEYIPDNAIVFADESHVTIPQIGGMYRGIRHARPLGARAHRRRVHRTGDPPHRSRRSRGGDPPGRDAGGRSSRGSAQGGRKGLSHARHHAHQAHGRGSHRIHARAGHPRALHAQRYRYHRAHRGPA